MTPIKKIKRYRKNEWRKGLGFWGEILYEWRPAKRGYLEIRNLLTNI